MRNVVCLASFACAALSLLSTAEAEQQLIEVRLYHLRSAEKAEQFDRTMKSMMPALQKIADGPVGVFQKAESDAASDDPHLRVTVLPLKNAMARTQLVDHISSIPGFWEEASPYLMQDKGDPAFTRIESMLLVGFTGWPRVVAPKNASGKERLFEMRTYESYSEIKGLLKVEMFNEGEFDIFTNVGLSGIFFGQAIAGGNLPQLTYMVVHDDEDAMNAVWDRFRSDKDWAVLRVDERYQDTVSKIDKWLLKATDYSEIK